MYRLDRVQRSLGRLGRAGLPAWLQTQTRPAARARAAGPTTQSHDAVPRKYLREPPGPRRGGGRAPRAELESRQTHTSKLRVGSGREGGRG